SRQALPTLDRGKYAPASGLARGAYVLADAPDGKPDVLLLATGSEVSLCMDAYEKLKQEGIKARVVSMPSREIFEYYCRKHPEYREQVLPPQVTGAGLGRAGLDFWLGSLCRHDRPEHRHGDVWRVGAAQGAAKEIRFRS